MTFPIPDASAPYPWSDHYGWEKMREDQLLGLLETVITQSSAILLALRDGIEREHYTNLVSGPILTQVLCSLDASEALLKSWHTTRAAAIREEERVKQAKATAKASV